MAVQAPTTCPVEQAFTGSFYIAPQIATRVFCRGWRSDRDIEQCSIVRASYSDVKNCSCQLYLGTRSIVLVADLLLFLVYFFLPAVVLTLRRRPGLGLTNHFVTLCEDHSMVQCESIIIPFSNLKECLDS